MTTLGAAHRGYEYQDLLAATRLVDLLLDRLVFAAVDEKLVGDDRFDDLTTLDAIGGRERVQIKHKDSAGVPLTLATFTSDARGLRMDRLVAAAIADRDGPGAAAEAILFRVVMRDARPHGGELEAVLRAPRADPGPFLPGLATYRVQFDADAIWSGVSIGGAGKSKQVDPFGFLREGSLSVARTDLQWLCDRLILELEAPGSSADLTNPEPADRLLLDRVGREVGAGLYPNEHRSPVDVAMAFIGVARSARQERLKVTREELLLRAQLRQDFGSVMRRNPVNAALEVKRLEAVDDLLRAVHQAADHGGRVLIVGPPGQGKSWLCQQLLERLGEENWLVAEHYCYLGEADGERDERVLADSLLGSLMARLADADPRLVEDQRPRFAADEQALAQVVGRARSLHPDRRVALIVDGIDHITRVRRGGPGFDPSMSLAETLSGLDLPPGSILIVLSQPGQHLAPIENRGALSATVPPMSADELRRLAAFAGVVPATEEDEATTPLLIDDDAINGFLEALADRSAGNALYATYLCREALREPATAANPAAAVRRLPPYDGTLEDYYNHLHAALGDSGWVADLIALLDFPVTRTELKEIRQDSAHRVDAAVDRLAPVLEERAMQGGVRVYHESFARFLRKPFQENDPARVALLGLVAAWLTGKGMFQDARAFRSLFSTLAEADRHSEVVDLVTGDYVVDAVASGFPASAIVSNLTVAIRSAAAVGDWPAVVRCVELSRGAETLQFERFDSELVAFADVAMALIGGQALADRLLHDGRPVMSGRDGLQMCAELDAASAVAPWREYLEAYEREMKRENTAYGEESDRRVNLAWLRGSLRLAASKSARPDETEHRVADEATPTKRSAGRDLDRIKWAEVARWSEEADLPAGEVMAAVVDIFGEPGARSLIAELSEPGAYCLALAELISSDRASGHEGEARSWAQEATAHRLPAGHVHRLLRLGVDRGKLAPYSQTQFRERALECTRSILEHSVQYEPNRLGEWLDACTIAAVQEDHLTLNAIEGLLEGVGWYRCWLRFVVALGRAEAAPAARQSRLAVDALMLLEGDLRPFAGDPRACDLYRIHGWIHITIGRALAVIDDGDWAGALELLRRVGDAVTVTLFGEVGGPLPADRLFRMAVDMTNPARDRTIASLIATEIEFGGGGRYYSDLAEYRLIAARLAVSRGDVVEAQRLWVDGCRLLTGYGWHKDITIYELLDPLDRLIALSPSQGRARVAAVQGLCERVPLHTDRKETRHTPARWLALLAAADPIALAELAARALLRDCNDPNDLLHSAREDLWQAWNQRADPIVSAALRLTLDTPLDKRDVDQLVQITTLTTDGDETTARRLMSWLLARADERSISYHYSNSAELRANDEGHVARMNDIARQVGAPLVADIPGAGNEPERSQGPTGMRPTPIPLKNRQRLLPSSASEALPAGAPGLAAAIRAWRVHRHDEDDDRWDADHMASVLGYRILEVAESGREQEAFAALQMIADADPGFGRGPSLLRLLAVGLERHRQLRLATVAYTLAWTRARGHGGWLTFGGETEIDALQNASRLDNTLTLSLLAQETAQAVGARRLGTYGVSQALILAFAEGGVSTDQPPLETAFRAWDEAMAVIAARAPRVDASDDPEYPYEPPHPDEGAHPPGDLDSAMAIAALGGLAHPSREAKRRGFLAAQTLLAARPAVAAPAFRMALAEASDAATLMWLLALLRTAGPDATTVIAECATTLHEIAASDRLTVRALARQVLDDPTLLVPPPTPADPALLGGEGKTLWTPDTASKPDRPPGIDGVVGEVAGMRLLAAERLLPGLSQAVIARVSATVQGEEYKTRMTQQLEGLTTRSEPRWPDAYLVVEEAVEEALQRAATGGRAALLARGELPRDPAMWEDDLAAVLLDEPHLALALEATREPRPVLPPPPDPDDPIWAVMRDVADGAAADGVLAAVKQSDGRVAGTVEILPAAACPTLESGRSRGWRIIGTAERRTWPPRYPDKGEDAIVSRYRALELRRLGEDQALTMPPVARGDPRAWVFPLPPSLPFTLSATQPILGIDQALDGADDAPRNLGIPTPLLVPTLAVVAALRLSPNSAFTLSDDAPAIRLVTWRTEYERSEYHLPWPRLVGCAVAIREDAFARLSDLAGGNLLMRDLIIGGISS